MDELSILHCAPPAQDAMTHYSAMPPATHDEMAVRSGLSSGLVPGFEIAASVSGK